MDEYGGYPMVGRRLRRLLWIGLVAGGIVAAALLWVRVEGERRLDEVERQVARRLGPTDLAAIERPPVPEGDNAALHYVEAGHLLDRTPESRHILRQAGRRPPGTWTPDEVVRLREAVARHRPALEALAATAADPGSRRDWQLPDRPVTPMLLVLDVARLLAAETRLAAHDGDPERAARALAQLRRLTEGLYDGQALILGLPVERISLGALRDALAAGLPLPAQPDRLLARTDPRRAHRRAMAGELAEELAAARRPGGALEMLTGTDFHPPWRWAFRLAGPWMIADYQHLRLAAVAADDEPYPQVMARVEAAAPPWVAYWPKGMPWSVDHGLLAARATLASRQLAVLALEASARATAPAGDQGGDPGALPTAPPDPLVGGPLAVERRADGSLLLAYPAALRSLPDGADHLADLLQWEVPAPGPWKVH
ncbi:MAG TPA: hypothetical protein VHQ65_05400 [Thermoanaerobaculia bacterium]|nr:hypothetical protein [Thermoanaerobaculia bacterium]